MNPTELREFLLAERYPLHTLAWMRDVFLPAAVVHLNSVEARRRLGLYSGERIPENERNLTDVRNRVSLILEYEFGRIVTKMLEDEEIEDVFVGYVVANRFPDLEIRHSSSTRGLRIEVKCLQAIAEEKSANFDTLQKDVHPQTDYVVVFLWEWQNDPTQVNWERAPKVLRSFIFHAATLARIRDRYWLNRPPNNLGDGVQGFDLRYAVNCVDGVYSEEEGNYGKLLRLWQEDFVHDLAASDLVTQTIQDYLEFKRQVSILGFQAIANLFLPVLSNSMDIVPVVYDGAVVGWKAGRVAFLQGQHVNTKQKKQVVLRTASASSVYFITERFSWTQYDFDGGQLTKVRNGKKPKHLRR